MTNGDAYDVLVALRPQSAADAAWPPDRRAATLDRILAAGPADGPERRGRGWRRGVIVAVASLGVLGAGVGVAGATGGLPQQLTDVFGPWQRDGGVDPRLATRAASMAGPGGSVFTVWKASGPNGYTCMSAGYETPEQAARREPAAFDAGVGSCVPPQAMAFGHSTGIGSDERAHTYEVSAGTAARAELRLADGTTMPALLVGSQFFGWYPSARPAGAADPELIGFDERGREIGRIPLKYPG